MRDRREQDRDRDDVERAGPAPAACDSERDREPTGSIYAPPFRCARERRDHIVDGEAGGVGVGEDAGDEGAQPALACRAAGAPARAWR